MRLTSEQVHFFRHSGYLKLPDRLPASMVDALKRAILGQAAEEVEPVVRNRDGKVVRLSQIWDRGGVFREPLEWEPLLDALAGLIGPNIEFILNRHNHACLRLAGDTPDVVDGMHRDVNQWTRSIVTALFYLEETNLENGCTWLVPGSHLQPGLVGSQPGRDEGVRRSGLLEQALPVPVPAGAVLLINGLIYHGAGVNRTHDSRISITAGYHSVDELAGVVNPKRVLLRGERPYGGNDRY